MEQRISALEEKAKSKNMQDTEFTIHYSLITLFENRIKTIAFFGPPTEI